LIGLFCSLKSKKTLVLLYTLQYYFNPQLAATGARWALLEFLVLAACDGMVASSGYGLTAAEVGGLSPQRTLRVKRGKYSDAGGVRRCFPSDAAPWMEFL
jgi:hypothetical protein